MIDTDVARWQFQSKLAPWRLAQINGRIAFGWCMESLTASRDTGAWDTEIGWVRPFCDSRLYNKATLADLFHLGLAWLKSHKLDAALVAMAAVSVAVFICRGAWLISQCMV